MDVLRKKGVREIKKEFVKGTSLAEAIHFLERAGASEITKVDEETFYFNTTMLLY